jgi:branched-chain amino acid transport system substrate-binding protein
MMSTPVQRALRCLAFLLTVALATGATSDAAVSAAPYEINAILSLTGGGAFLGKSEAQAILLIQDYVNKTGGINGRPIKFTILDDASSPQIAVQLAGPILAHNVPVIVGPDLTALCSAITPLIEKSGPLVYCISPGINPAANSYMFSGSVSLRADAVALVRFFRERHWTRMALITSTDATGQSFEEAYNRALALPENKLVDSVDIEHFANSDLSVAGQVTRLKAANPQAVIAWTTGTSFATLLRGFHDGGYDGPVGGGNGNMIYAQLTQYNDFMPKQMYFPGQRALAEGTAAGPVHDAQAIYLKVFAGAGVQHPDWGDMAAWDPTMVTIDALRHVGLDATPEQVRAYVLNLHSWAGISGIYDFRDGLQRGIGIESVVIDQWIPARGYLTAASKPGGMPLP